MQFQERTPHSGVSVWVRKLGALGARSLSRCFYRMGAWLTPYKHVLSPRGLPCRLQSLLVKRYKRTYRDPPENNWAPRVPPFRATQSHRWKKTTCIWDAVRYRRILAVKWQDRRTNEEIRAVVWRKETVVDTIRMRKLHPFRHICRMPDDRLLKTLLFGMIDGERRPGRPARRWIGDILKCCGKDLRDGASTTEDRTKWRQFVTSPYGPCWSWDQKKKKKKKVIKTDTDRPGTCDFLLTLIVIKTRSIFQ